jgi:hypothetical protein
MEYFNPARPILPPDDTKLYYCDGVGLMRAFGRFAREYPSLPITDHAFSALKDAILAESPGMLWRPRHVAATHTAVVLGAEQVMYAADGPAAVSDMVGQAGVTFHYSASRRSYAAIRATAIDVGQRDLLLITTDKGRFSIGADMNVRLSTGIITPASELKPGRSLQACSINMSRGYARIGLHDGHKTKRFLHQLIIEDVMGYELQFPDLVTDHLDRVKTNNDPSNLMPRSNSDHAHRHSSEAVAAGEHIFQNRDFPHGGENNGMHRSARFWRDGQRVDAYRRMKSQELLDRGTAKQMQDRAGTQRMLNLAYKLINAGYDISTFDAYIAARNKYKGPIWQARKIKESIDRRFGSYKGFLDELARRNHRVLGVERLGSQAAMAVELLPIADCQPPDRNIVVWPNLERAGSGIVIVAPQTT